MANKLMKIQSLLAYSVVLTITIVLLLPGLHPAAEQMTAPRKPNIIIILADDLGYGDLSSYGAKDLKTPNIDRIITGGIRFNNFYANSPVCSPTRAALMSGRYPDVVGVPGVIRTHANNNWGVLSRQATFLPQMLKKAGYQTALIGKWHLGLDSPNLPNERGFDHFYGFLGDMMDDYYTHRRHDINYMRRNDQTIDPEGHATDLFTEWALEYLNERKKSSQPFFLYLAYNAPHTPIQPPDEWLAKVKKREPGIGDQRARLVALIEHLDHGIGRVIETLRSNGQADQTLLVFTSDNGGQLNVGGNCGPFRGGKQDLYEGGIRVPFGATWPGRIKPGTRSEGIALTMDLFPTVCEAAGVKIDYPIDGVSILPLLWNQNQPPFERDLFWMRREGGPPYYGQDYYAVRRGPWKLVHNHPFEPLQLYNLKSDPFEKHDVAKENRQVFDEMIRALQAQIQRAGAVTWQKPSE